MSRTLFTKDGRRTGNAIVIKEVQPKTEALKSFLAQTNSKIYLLETDFGDRLEMSREEIERQFNWGPRTTYEEWAADRAELREQNMIEDQVDKHDREAVADQRPVCSEDGCYRRKDCGPLCRNRN